MKLLSIRNFFCSALFMRVAAGLAVLVLTCGFGHQSGDLGQWITIGLYQGSSNCDYCAAPASTPHFNMKCSTDGGNSWITEFDYDYSSLYAYTSTYTFLVPKTGNCLISVISSGKCNGNIIVCTSRPDPFLITWPWSGGQIHYIPLYCTGCGGSAPSTVNNQQD